MRLRMLAASGALLALCACGAPSRDTVHAAPSATAAPSTTAPVLGHRHVRFHGEPMELEVYGLHRRGGLAVLSFGARNTSTADADDLDAFAGPRDSLGRGGVLDVSGVHLSAPSEGKAYLPARYDGECLCSKNLEGESVGPGRTMKLTATYAAVPPSVTTVDITFAGHGTVRGIPVR